VEPVSATVASKNVSDDTEVDKARSSWQCERDHIQALSHLGHTTAEYCAACLQCRGCCWVSGKNAVWVTGLLCHYFHSLSLSWIISLL